MNIKEEVKKLKTAAPFLAASTNEQRNKALTAIAAALRENADRIFEANRQDLDNAEKNGVAPAVKKRLKFDEHKLEDVTAGIEQLTSLADPIGRTMLSRELDSDLTLYRVTCPIGVIGVIFEARPDALVQISSLCIKSGNCAILKGGKETANTNRVLFGVIYDAAVKSGLPENILLQAEQHNEIDELLDCHEEVDLLIPTGSNKFVKYIMDNTKIPVMGHADGICHIYVNKAHDTEMALKVIIDAKTQYTAVCNAVETLLIDREIAEEFLPKLKAAADKANVELRGTKEVTDIIGGVTIDESEFIEYLDLKASVKLVSGVDEAIAHINKYGSHHTDCIITTDDAAAERFMQMVDSAGVYRNCSTRFADGFRYGFGAEVGVSTGKIHARGPVGLDGLVTYKYKLIGNGNIVADYAEKRRQFHHRDL